MPRKPTPERPPRLVGYTRVSTAEQADRGLSLAAQGARIESYCEAKAYELVGIERDPAESGATPPARRAGLSRALAAVRAREADGIVTVRLDRLSRRATDTLHLADESQRRGWLLVSIDENIDTLTASGRLFVTVLAGLAQHEREVIGERTRLALAKVAAEGRARSRFVPFGYRIASRRRALEVKAGDRRQLVPDATEQRVLRRILRYRQEGLGPRRIARALNDRGVVKPRTGCPWTPSSIQKILATVDRRASALAPFL